jgi:hypothetical protein
MQTLTLNRSDGGFMKRILMVGAVVLLGLGATGVALANTAIELVTGTGANQDIVFYDGSSLTCSIGGVVHASDCTTLGASVLPAGSGSLSIEATKIGGWDVDTDTGDSKAPSCDANQVCEDQNEVNAVNKSGTAALNAYFASSGFTTAGPLSFAESATASDGTATARAYVYQPDAALGLSNTTAPSLTGLFSTLSLSNPGFKCSGQITGETCTPSVGQAAPPTAYNLASELSFTAGKAGAGYSVTETIYTTAVPESSSVGVFLAMLFGVAFVVRKGTQRRTSGPAQTA